MLPQCAVAPLGARQDPWSQPKLSGAIFSSRQRQHLCPFWTPILDLALGAENFGIFTLGAEAAFCVSLANLVRFPNPLPPKVRRGPCLGKSNS